MVAFTRRKTSRNRLSFFTNSVLFIKHISDFGYTRKSGDKMPRANAWRPYRFAVQDVIFGDTVVRHSKETNCVEVDVFLTAEPRYGTKDDIPENQSWYPYEPLAAAKAQTLMLLSEAFRCGTDLRLRFTNNVERSEEERSAQAKTQENRGRVPFAISQIAADAGIQGIDRESGLIDTPQARELYVHLCGFPPSLKSRIRNLANDGLLTVERACYLVQHGVWTAPELEGLIRSSPYPDLVLDGEVQPENRHLYYHAQFATRAALLGGVLDRALMARDPDFQGKDLPPINRPKGRAEGATQVADPEKAGKDSEDDERDLVIEYDGDFSARLYKLGPNESDNLPVPDWRPFSVRNSPPVWADGVPTDGKLAALLRPYDQVGMLQFLGDDIARAKDFPRSAQDRVAIVLPLDFNDLNEEQQEGFLKKSARAGVWIMICPETARTLDGYAREKLNRSRVLPE